MPLNCGGNLNTRKMNSVSILKSTRLVSQLQKLENSRVFARYYKDEKPISSKTTVAIGPADSPASSTTTATCFNAEEYVNLTVEPSILKFDIITKDFLEGLEPGLSIFLETIETDKLAMISIDSLAKCYNIISEQIKVLEQQTVRQRKESRLSKDLQLLHHKLRTFKSTINSCLAITIEPALGLLKLQQDALAKQKLVNETCVQATTIKTFIVERNFKQSLTRRLNQIKTRDKLNDEQPSKLSTIKMFCNNGSDLTWEPQISRILPS